MSTRTARHVWRPLLGGLAIVLAAGCARALAQAQAAPPPARLRAAAVKVDITPRTPQWLMGYQARQSDGVLDNIYHRVVALDSGDAQLYVIASDLCLFSPTLYDSVTSQLQKETGIPSSHVLWSVTHSHATPEVGPPDMYKVLLGRSDHEWDREYTGSTTRALIDAVRTAREKLEPARIAFGTGTSMANINRRAKDVDGRVSLGLNPDGPADRQINLIRLDRPDGSPIAVIANYAMHGTVMNGQNLKVSGDGPGVVSAYVEQKIGAPVLYVNGAAGNLAPIYSVYPSPSAGHLSEFRVLLGDRILAALASMGPATSDVTMRVAEKIIETPRKARLAWPDELSPYKAGSDEHPLVRLPIRFVRINDTAIWSAPVELFCEIAMDVREASPFSRTFYFGYTNGWFGYLPTAKAFEEGGYEPRTSTFSPQVETDVRNAVVAFLQGFRGPIHLSAADGAQQAKPADLLARQILDPAKSNAERDKIIAGASVDAGALITALINGLEPGTPEEYVRIPSIWRVAVAAGRRNQIAELKSVLAASLPGLDEPLRDWQAVVIGGGVVNGVSLAGAWPADRLPEVLRGEKSLTARWRRVPDLAAAMAADEKIKTGTRYDALRILGAESWKRRGDAVIKYLADGTHPEVQQGAIGALGDMKGTASARALLEALPRFSDRNRNTALNALMRDEARMGMLLDAVSAGRVPRASIGTAREEKLKTAGNPKIRTKAEKILR